MDRCTDSKSQIGLKLLSNSLQKTHFLGMVIVILIAFALYVFTLAPTVLWGDSGLLQLRAYEGVLRGSAGSHPLWVGLSNVFVKLLPYAPAKSINMVSAVFASLTVGLVYLVLRDLALGRLESSISAAALMISHTFWSHAVQAEVYTLTLTFMVGLIGLGIRYYRTGKSSYLFLIAFVAGLGLSAHLMVVLYLPAIAWLVILRKVRLGEIVATAAVFFIGCIPLLFLVYRDAHEMQLRGFEIVRWALFSFEGYDFSGAFFDFSITYLLKDILEWGAYSALQFVGISLLFITLGFVNIWRDDKKIAWYVLILYLGSLAFAFAYRVGDRYVFYLPAYIILTIWLGFGLRKTFHFLREYIPSPERVRVVVLMIFLLMMTIPVMSYHFGPELVSRGITFRDTRHVPGPRGRYFFLWPPKRNYTDPRDFALSVLEHAPQNAVLLADPILSSPVKYLQEVEKRRPDVDVRFCCWNIRQVLHEIDARPILIADVASQVYPVEYLSERYEISSCGAGYLLTERSE